jgi:Predicted AAA-ATPase.
LIYGAVRKEETAMARAVGIGHQDFEIIRKEGYFYIDKTDFIRQGSGDLLGEFKQQQSGRKTDPGGKSGN